MKVVHIARQFYPSLGGVENVVVNLARRQVLLGHKVSVVTLNRLFDDGEKLSKSDEIFGIEIHRIPFCGSRRYPIAPSVVRYIGDADIVHIHCVDFFVDYLVLTKWWHKKKIILHTHGGFFHTKWMIFFKKIYFNTITRLALKGCAKVIAVSENDYEMFSKISSNVVLVENGVDIERFSLAQKNISKGKLVYLGRVDRHKRIDNLIKVIAMIKKRGVDVSLEIYGPDIQSHMAELKELSSKLGVENMIVWKGKASDEVLLLALAEAQLFLSASEYEGFGISAVEAMASGTISVLNKIDSFKKILGEESQLLIDFSNTEDAAKKIVELINISKKQYGDIAEGLKKRAKMFSWELAIEKFETIYLSCQ